ncbi:uncharacterized protein BDV14DRAFT_186686 [Aspergillus stella-maris]|uniref:uncharacterized protein n=1 Tax=Aspergillus stella-maris TaxID=1810926 RepID=UPI003CCD292C
MGTGKCTAHASFGMFDVACPCPAGLFTWSESAFETICQRCGHPLQDHRDFSPEPALKEESTSASDSEHAQEHVMEVTTKPTRCRRNRTVLELASALDNQDVIHVRGTPASGKTTLSELLRDYYLENNRKVFLLEYWKPLDFSHGQDAWTGFSLRLQHRYPGYHSKDFFASKNVILIDEAQGSYADIGFWNTVIKDRRSNLGYDIKICLFSSYGSPWTGLDSNKVVFTPATFGPPQRVTLTPQPNERAPKIGLFFTKEEFDQAVDLLTTRQYKEKFDIDAEARRYLFALTDGHPGAVASLVGFVHYMHRHNLKHGCYSTITKDYMLDALKDDAEVFTYLESQAVFRSFPQGRSFTPEAAATLSTILEEGNMLFKSEDIGMQACYQNGWVNRITVGTHLTADIAVLPSRLHEKYIEFIIGRESRSLPAKFTRLDDLCLAVLGNFSTINLRHAAEGKKISTAAKHTPIEAQYQDEFYRSFNLLAGRGVPICSEWSRTRDGRVDFYIPEKKWAIELLRDHDRVHEHVSRFKVGGSYYSWVEEGLIDDWIIIDCATSLPASGYSEPRLWNAVFDDDYTNLRVYNNQEELLSIRLKN